MTRYAIVGAGAVGGYYGGMLASAGHEVHFIVRGDFEALRKRGLRLDTADGGHFIRHVQVHRGADTIPPCDVVLVCLKMTQLAALADYLPRIVASDGVVLALQNGLGAEEALAALVPTERIFGAVCYVCATRTAPGCIHQADTNGIYIAPLVPGSRNQRVDELVKELSTVGVEAELHENLGLLRWRKLAWNIPYNALCAHLRQPTTPVNEHPPTRALVRDLMEEVRAGCSAVTGHDLPAELVDEFLELTDAFDHYKPSMLVDVEAKRPLELEAILGEPVRRAASAGAPMLRTEMLYRLLSFDQTRR